MRRAPTAVLAGLLLTTAACAPMKNLDRNVPFDAASGDSVVVMGVEPRYRVGVRNGTIREGVFRVSREEKGWANAFPEDGYIVFRVRPKAAGEHYGIVHVLPEGVGLGVPTLSPCDGADTATFEIKPGQVVYVGDVRYVGTQERMRPRYSFNLAAAQEFIDQNYPRLKRPLTTSRFEIMQVGSMPCFR
jgi:hypothetical protein